MTQDLLKILCCPETHQSLAMADAETIARLNEQIKAGALKNRGGKAVSEAIDGGLVRDDRKFLYPIRGKIPVMLIDEAITLERHATPVARDPARSQGGGNERSREGQDEIS